MDASYDRHYNSKFQVFKSSRDNFISTVRTEIGKFATNRVFESVNTGRFQIADYHNLLKRLFHQVYYSSNTFSLAASRCDFEYRIIRDYLIHHADEEKKHWTWIINDLENTGFNNSPQEFVPDPDVIAYYSYAHYLANKNPILRLGMAYVLESISGQYGVEIGIAACKTLGINKDQATFFVGHGELDQGHSTEILDVFNQFQFSPEIWGELVIAGKTTSYLYLQLYNNSVMSR